MYQNIRTVIAQINAVNGYKSISVTKTGANEFCIEVRDDLREISLHQSILEISQKLVSSEASSLIKFLAGLRRTVVPLPTGYFEVTESLEWSGVTFRFELARSESTIGGALGAADLRVFFKLGDSTDLSMAMRVSDGSFSIAETVH